MKSKFLALAAFGAAVLGGAVVSAPANAQIPAGSGPNQNVTVNVSVPEVLYLRTITTANINITPADLTATPLTGPLAGSTPPAYIGSEQSPGATVDAASPFAGGFADPASAPIPKTITSAYIVWSNSPTGTYTVQITPPAGGLTLAGAPAGATATVTATVAGTNPRAIPAEGLVTSTPQDIPLLLQASDDNITAGTYSGAVRVEAYRP